MEKSLCRGYDNLTSDGSQLYEPSSIIFRDIRRQIYDNADAFSGEPQQVVIHSI